MVNYDIRKLQLRILNILKSVDQVCTDHHLTYYIWAGTMIGAIRHHGFIPWDDDIDIAMPREDYNRIIENSTAWLPTSLEMVCTENDSSYPLPFAKIQDSTTTLIERMHLKYLGGIYIDVFPLDGVPKGWIKQKLHFGQYEYYKRILYLVHRNPYKHGKGPSCWIPLLCRHLFRMEEIQRKIRKILIRYPFSNSRLIADYDDGFHGKMDKSVLGKPTAYKFEDTTVKGVQNYGQYLSQKYGNYMEMPPEEKRHQHNFYYLDLNHSYRAFKD
ncbi:MAG: LicD family protein [Prevotella sp.]|jgi:lipopolysaccharide cholinephosphotransferase|nr:LicD family protein [Prevotella sp.]MCI1518984.1 LicD family protein [Prevotella sp.]MCI1549791.1 LicD family protein [Prevotella sp.]